MKLTAGFLFLSWEVLRKPIKAKLAKQLYLAKILYKKKLFKMLITIRKSKMCQMGLLTSKKYFRNCFYSKQLL
jgi:hypothetical protein